MKIAIIKTEQEIFSEKKNRNINKRLKILAIFLFLLFLILFIIISKFHQKTKIIFRSKKENEIYKNIAKKQKVELKLLELKIQQLKNQLIINEVEFNHTIKYYLDTIKKYNHSLYNKIELNIKFKNDLLMKINRTYTKNGVVNINKIESKIKGGRKWYKSLDKKKEINIGFQLDPSYILRAMVTLASIIDSQKLSTKLRFHFAVVLEFNAKHMLKIYSLREKLREDVEFNFYNAKKAENDFKGMHPKGPGAVAKILLPHLLPNDIEKLLIFDTGDVLVLRDLSEMYNWNMSDYLYMGVPDPGIGKIGRISQKPLNVYINIGHFLLNVQKIKSKNMYNKYLKYKNVYSHFISDQDLLNDVAQKEIGYLPIKFGIFSPFRSDSDSDRLDSINQYEITNLNENKLKNTNYYIPKNSNEYFKLSYNPVVIHQWNGKWQDGQGLSIYRRLAQNYIRIAGIWDELCLTLPGYCRK